MKTTIIDAAFVLSLAILGPSCGPNQRILESANANKSAGSEPIAVNASAPPVTSFEQDLNSMRTADFKFIVVIRRKDRQPLEAADKALIAKEGSQANRRRLSDEGKAVIIGSNFPFLTGTFDGLRARFNLENYSKPDSGAMFSNGAANE